jgi:hypothetical protein
MTAMQKIEKMTREGGQIVEIRIFAQLSSIMLGYTQVKLSTYGVIDEIGQYPHPLWYAVFRRYHPTLWTQVMQNFFAVI